MELKFPYSNDTSFTSLYKAWEKYNPLTTFIETSSTSQFTLKMIEDLGGKNLYLIEDRSKVEEQALTLALTYSEEGYISHSLAEKLHSNEADAISAYQNLFLTKAID